MHVILIYHKQWIKENKISPLLSIIYLHIVNPILNECVNYSIVYYLSIYSFISMSSINVINQNVPCTSLILQT